MTKQNKAYLEYKRMMKEERARGIYPKKTYDAYEELMTKVYAKAIPKITWVQYQKKYCGTKIQGFEKYFVPMEVQEKIFEEIIKKYKLKQREANALRIQYFLGCSPTSAKPKRKQE